MDCEKNILYTYKKKNCFIEYEFITDGIYIHSIKSVIQKKKYGSICLKNFLENFKKYDIFLEVSSLMGTPKDVLSKWYESFGFKPINSFIGENNYKISHLLKR